jgi:hypothetical protein
MNAGISPRNNLTRHQGFIDSCMYGMILNGNYVRYTKGERDQDNNETQDTDYVTTWVEEYEGYQIGELNLFAPRYFKNIIFEVEAPYPYNFAQIVSANPRGYITFVYDGVTYSGYIISIEGKIAGKGSQNIKLLSLKENDLTQLIR